MTELQLDVFVQAAAMGFGLCLIGWFAAWGISKAVHVFRHITKL